MNDLLRQLREYTDFHVVMQDMLANRPVIPDYQPQATRDETENLLERIKYCSAQRAGFDLLFRLMTGHAP